MPPISTVVGGLSILPSIISGVESIISLFRREGGGAQRARVIATGGPGFPGAPPIPIGTAVGPGTPAFIAAGFDGGLIAPVGRLAGTLVRRVLGPAVVGGVAGQLVAGGNGAAPTTRKAQILAVARANNPGATQKKIIKSARECGIELAAATFGLDVLSVCFLIAQPVRRRGRGISAADMRRTRSTIRKVANIQHDLVHLGTQTRARARSRK